jgi:hypothetical protein
MTDPNEHALSLMSPSDRAALAEMDEEEKAAIAAEAGGTSPLDAPMDKDEEVQTTPVADPAAAPTPAPAPGDATQSESATPPTDAAPTPVAQVVPTPAPAPQATVYTVEKPADFDAQLAAITADKAAIKARLRAGEIDVDAYEEQVEALAERSAALNNVALKAEIATEITEQTQAAQWASAIGRQLDAAKLPENGGVDYAANPALMNELDLQVRALGNNPAHADKSFDWFMTEAHRRVLILNDLKPPVAAPAPTAKSPADATKAAAAARAPAPSAIPISLANVPDAGGEDKTQGSEFAAIDLLTGVDQERAIARLSQADQERFFAMG